MIRKCLYLLATLLFCLSASYVFAQDISSSDNDIPPYDSTAHQTGNNYYKDNIRPQWNISVQGGIATAYTDVKNNIHSNFMIGAGLQYRALYYLDVVIDFGSGKLSAGEEDANAANKKMKFTNDIFTVSALARFAPLKLVKNISYNAAMYYISNFYLGAGIGLMKNKVDANIFKDDSYQYIGNNDGSNAILPLELGISLPIFHLAHQQNINLNINYRFNFCLDDKEDGYKTPPSVNKRNDVYNTLLFGIGYRF